MRHLAIPAAALALLSACAEGDPTQSGFFREAGLPAAGSDGGFGQATMNNVLTQSGEADYRVSLNNRFAAEVPTTINFAFNSAELDGEARAILQRQADWIRQFPEVRFKVFGHTDLVGSEAYNRQLGQRRAEAAVNYLVGQGISRSRLEAVVSFGESRPLVVTTAPERRNRRTVTEVSGFVRNHPSVLNGKYAEIIFRDYVASAGVTATTQGISGSELAAGQ
jgi:outer membrane protein OmpA-like peptidoglycan-associated protein